MGERYKKYGYQLNYAIQNQVRPSHVVIYALYRMPEFHDEWFEHTTANQARCIYDRV